MKKTLQLLILIIFIFTLITCIGCDSVKEKDMLDANEIKSNYIDYIFKIYTYDLDGKDKQGTGFICNKASNIMTNAHVMEDAYSAKAQKNSTSIRAIDSVIEYNYETSDYCTLNPVVKQIIYNAPKFTENYKPGDICYSLGFPNDSPILTIKKGEIIGDIIADGINYIENTAEIDHGSSGGVLVNAAGEIIGMTTCSLDSGNYGAIPYSDFKEATKYSAIKEANAKSVLETFHTLTPIILNTSNVFTYFDLSYLKIQETYCSAKYEIYISLKEKYRKKVRFNGTNVSITINVETFFLVETKSSSDIISDENNITFKVDELTTFPITRSSYTSYLPAVLYFDETNLGTEITISNVSGTIYLINE